jgi:hypothetical protein
VGVAVLALRHRGEPLEGPVDGHVGSAPREASIGHS